MDNVKNELAEDNSSMYKFTVNFFKTLSLLTVYVLKYLVFLKKKKKYVQA